MKSTRVFLVLLLSLALSVFVYAKGSFTSNSFGNASCSGHQYSTESRKADPLYSGRHCDLLTGDPNKISTLKEQPIPDGGRLLVLGRSEALEGYDHGDTWFKVKIKNGRIGFVDDHGIQCDGESDSCKESLQNKRDRTFAGPGSTVPTTIQ
jgi:hypothetical protein